MIKELRRKKGEPLYIWVKRFCDHYCLSDEVADGVREISRKSYIAGVLEAREISEKFKK